MNEESSAKSEASASSKMISADGLDLHRRQGVATSETANALGSTPTVQFNGAAQGESEFDFLRHVRLALRGRYAWVIGLGILTGVFGAFYGWRLGHQIYVSTGLVRIAYQLPVVMNQTDENGPIEMFDTFMDSQRLLITSRHVLDIALQDPIWRTTGHAVPSDPDDYFHRHLTVTIAPHSEFIQISVTDGDPGMAAAAVNSVINAYAQLYERQSRQLEDARMDALNEKRTPLEEKIQHLTSEINVDAADFGTTDLETFFADSEFRLSKSQAALEDIRAAIAMAPPDGTPGPAGQIANTPTAMSAEQIAMVDPQMRILLDEKGDSDRQLQHDLKDYGPNSTSIHMDQRAIDLAQGRIDQYAQQFQTYHFATGQNLGDPGQAAVLTAGRSLESLRESETRLSKLCEDEKAEMLRLGTKRMELDRLAHELADDKDDLDKVVRRADALQGEDSMGGRLSIASSGEIPLGPTADPRLKLAAAGGLAASVVPAMVLILASFLLRDKYRFAEEAESHSDATFPLLGVLPTLDSTDVPGGEEMSNAAHSIHQIRVTLRSRAPRDRSSSLYLITSAAAGEGKTSLTMSLGLSFAACRMRTLLIDGDLVGRQLTNMLQARNLLGLQEAMASGSIRKLIRKTSRNLYYLPAGQVTTHDAWSLSPAKLRPLLAQVRRHFDVVLLDTGPILGSVEAAVLAQEVDGVLFMIARDQRRALVERAVNRLRKLDAPLEGFIFNRAISGDFEASAYGSSSARSTAAWASTPVEASSTQIGRFSSFGPLVQAVAMTVPDSFTRTPAAISAS